MVLLWPNMQETCFPLLISLKLKFSLKNVKKKKNRKIHEAIEILENNTVNFHTDTAKIRTIYDDIIKKLRFVLFPVFLLY